MTKTKPTTIDEYIDAAPDEAKEKLNQIREILREVAPKAVEKIKWGYPVLEEKRILFAFMAFKKYISFMPTRSTLDVFREEARDYVMGKDTIQFSYNQELPVDLIRSMAIYREKDVREHGALWMLNS